jgi:hypothetical protein
MRHKMDRLLIRLWQFVAWRCLRRPGDPPLRIQLAFDRESTRKIGRS